MTWKCSVTGGTGRSQRSPPSPWLRAVPGGTAEAAAPGAPPVPSGPRHSAPCRAAPELGQGRRGGGAARLARRGAVTQRVRGDVAAGPCPCPAAGLGPARAALGPPGPARPRRRPAMANVADTKLYDILGVPPGASDNELKKVRRRGGGRAVGGCWARPGWAPRAARAAGPSRARAAGLRLRARRGAG